MPIGRKNGLARKTNMDTPNNGFMWRIHTLTHLRTGWCGEHTDTPKDGFLWKNTQDTPKNG